MPLRIGLTGGIGSGKSLVADELARRGAHLVDADAIARDLTAPGGRAIDAITARFGPAFLDASGALDRDRMRALVFRDPQAKAALERILHPMVRAEADARSNAVPDDCPYVVLVVPLLVESGNWKQRVDRVLVVDCPVAVQVGRVLQRSGLDEPTARSIIAAQATRAQRLDAADDVLVNASTAAGALAAAARLHQHYAALGRATGAAGAL